MAPWRLRSGSATIGGSPLLLLLASTCLIAQLPGLLATTGPASQRSESFAGWSTDGKVYQTAQEAWQDLADRDGSFKSHYKKSASYWSEQEPSNKGVLCGYDELHEPDIQDSEAFLVKAWNYLSKGYLKKHGRKLVVADCGAGVGRISRNLLLRYFGTVDVVEPVSRLMDQARESLGLGATLPEDVPKGHKVDKFFEEGLQQWAPESYRYDAYWIQWCLMYLTDDDLGELFVKLRFGLKENGIIFIKENVAPEGFVVDRSDRSVTRSRAMLEDLFKATGYLILEHAVQTRFPEDVYAVHMWALIKKPAQCGLLEEEIRQRHYNGELLQPT